MFAIFKNAMPSAYITAYCNGKRLYYAYGYKQVDKACRKQVEENPDDIYYVKFADKTLISFYEHGKEPVYLRNSQSFLNHDNMNRKTSIKRSKHLQSLMSIQDTLLDAHYNERVRLLELQQQQQTSAQMSVNTNNCL